MNACDGQLRNLSFHVVRNMKEGFLSMIQLNDLGFQNYLSTVRFDIWM
jgi:hypothetical protein